ncbi:hypothetical protein [Nocardia nova]|uniref:hypothetical protein n=1 Tax=Nocardia nova TaxID=37330 RepID=UPI0011DE4202|nr:hypothetical protein [Nocardia nova]
MTDEKKSKGSVSRRSVVLGSAVAAAGVGVGMAAAKSVGGEEKMSTAEESFTVVDKRGKQRFLMSASKPPIILGGRTYPVDQRQGRSDTSYLLFNDENGDEKGGIIVGSNDAMISFDYPNGDAIHLGANWKGDSGGAALSMTHLGNPNASLEEAVHPPGVHLFVDTEHGTGLFLCDPQGRPRIRLLVAPDGTPSIAMLDESGAVVKQL